MDAFQRKENRVIMKARKLIRELGVSEPPVELDLFARKVNAKIRLCGDMEEDESGQTTQLGGKHLILVNGNHGEERRRFTVLHEIAHIYLELPSNHHGHVPTTSSLLSYRGRPEEEMLCDVFAAECLMPYEMFSKDVRELDVCLESIRKLRQRYKASLTTVGSRFVVNADEACAFVLSEAGYIRYVSRSKRLNELKGWIGFGTPLPEGSVAHRLREDPSRGQDDGEVPSDVWFSGGIQGHSMVMEETALWRELDQCLSLLWLDDGMSPPNGSQPHGDSEESLLRELDGVLPWPSKNRRR